MNDKTQTTIAAVALVALTAKAVTDLVSTVRVLRRESAVKKNANKD